MESQLLPFQRLGVQFCLSHGGRGLIGDEMGLGKTIQALAVAACYRDEWPILVVTTSSLREQWCTEMSAWLDIPRNEIVLHTPGASIPNMDTYSALVINYEGIVKLSADLRGKFNLIILDESHNIKNPTAARTKACLKLGQQCKRLILLSGTPATSRPFELLQQIKALLPAAKLTQQAFCDRYCAGDFFGKTKGSKNEEELNVLLCSTIMVRRLKKDVMENLKPKHRQLIYLTLSGESCQKLRQIKKRLESVEMDESFGDESTWELSIRTRKNMILNELFHESAKEKIRPVQDYVLAQLQETRKMLLFAHHKEMMDGLELVMNQRNIRYIRIDGSTPGVKRNELKKRFQDIPDVRVALLAIKAAGTGLNFTAANVVVFTELSWVPGDIKQCEDRAHRIGQHSNVFVKFLLGRESIDEIIWKTLQNKLDYVGQILDGNYDTLDVQKKHGNSNQKSLHGFLTNTQTMQAVSGKRGSELKWSPVSKKGKLL